MKKNLIILILSLISFLSYSQIDRDYIQNDTISLELYKNEYNYNFEKYTKQANIGRYTSLFGYSLITVGVFSFNQNNNTSEILICSGAIIIITGFITEWSALKHLKNISISNDEIKYTFKF